MRFFLPLLFLLVTDRLISQLPLHEFLEDDYLELDDGWSGNSLQFGPQARNGDTFYNVIIKSTDTYILTRIDKDLKVIQSFEVKIPEMAPKKFDDLEVVNVASDYPFIYTFYTYDIEDRDIVRMVRTSLNVETKVWTEPVTIFEYSEEKHNKDYVHTRVRITDSGTVFAYCYECAHAAANCRWQIRVFNKHQEEIMSKDFIAPDQEIEPHIGFGPLDNGSFFIINQINESILQRDGEPYIYRKRYADVHLNDGETVVRHQLADDLRRPNQILYHGDDQKIILTGHYQMIDTTQGRHGTFYKRISMITGEMEISNYIPFEENYDQEVRGDYIANRDKTIIRPYEYDARSLHALDDGAVVTVCEAFERQNKPRLEPGSKPYTYPYNYIYGNILMTCWNSDGQVRWVALIPKLQLSQINSSDFSIGSFSDGQSTYVFYNANVTEGDEDLMRSELKRTGEKVTVKSVMLSCSYVNNGGTMKTTVAGLYGNDIWVAFNDYFRDEKEIYFYTNKENGMLRFKAK